MDHPHYRYSPLPARPRWTWPNGARLAVCVLLYLEHWELQPPEGAHRDPRYVGEFGSWFPDYRTWTQREYGNRVGVFRVLEVLDALRIVPAVPVNAMAIERYPRLVYELGRRGAEFLGHGISASRMLTSRLTEAEERDVIGQSLDAIEHATGARPRGWVSPDFGESTRTPQLLAEVGLRYVLDWPNDDQPYRLTTAPPLVSIPNQSEWDDVQLLWLRRIAMPRYPALLAQACAALCAEGEQSARVLTIGLHPWLVGMASRVRYLREALEAITGREGVWFAAPGEIADAADSALAAATPR
jgi:peptidoglycan/xylan/chitin deacetylase (PgdA/CDA1 family)